MRSGKPLMPKVEYSITSLGAAVKTYATYPGGLDLVTPTLGLQPGALRAAVNFEVAVQGGYGRILGYERVDGRQSPSSAGFSVVQVMHFINAPAIGDVVTQASSGATGTVAGVSSNPDYMVVTKATGTFDSTGVVTKPGPVTVGTATTLTVGLTAKQSAIYTAASADVYRALITAVPGSGPVLGVVYMHLNSNDGLYAFRANVGNTAVNIYKASTSGWTLVPFFKIVSFTAGTGGSPPLDGQTLTQGGVTATLQRVMWQSGAWAGTAVGQLVITTPAGGSFAAGAATAPGGVTVTLAGPETTIALTPGGRYEFSDGNFTGRASTDRVYGADGLNKAFEFDGVTYAPITTGLPTDAPLHVNVHKGYLFLSYGSSALYSGPGTPFKYSAVDGAGEIAVGDNITGMITLPGNESTSTQAIFQTSNTSFLYGTSASTWQLTTYNTGVGARPYSIQNVFDTFSFDDFGVMTLQATLNFGNFSSSAVTRNILPFILPERSTVVASGISRTKGQYRVFFRDGFGLYLTIANQTYLGAIPVLYPNPVTCSYNDKTASGDEVSYFGSTNGFVYQFDKGTSFDGAEIFAYITLAWDALKSPRVFKRFRSASMEISGTGYAAVNFGYQLGYGTNLIAQPLSVETATPFAPAPMWDSFTWDSFTWDGFLLAPTDVDMTGTAENVQVTIQSATNYIAAYQVNSVIYHYTLRRGMRV